MSETTPLAVMKWSGEIDYADYLFACVEETEIEARLCSLLELADDRDDEIQRKEIQALRAALRMIDRIPCEPELLETQREIRVQCEASLKKVWDGYHVDEARIQNALDNAAVFENYQRGLNSSDPSERARFQDFKRQFVGKGTTLQDILPALRLAAQAKKPDGRPTMSPPWRGIDLDLQRVRSEIAGGKTKTQAIQTVACKTNAIGGGFENKVARLRKAYVAKMKLREET